MTSLLRASSYVSNTLSNSLLSKINLAVLPSLNTLPNTSLNTLLNTSLNTLITRRFSNYGQQWLNKNRFSKYSNVDMFNFDRIIMRDFNSVDKLLNISLDEFNLNGTLNTYFSSEWLITNVFNKICATSDVKLIDTFYNNKFIPFINNLSSWSLDPNKIKLIFYNYSWDCDTVIDYDVKNTIINDIFIHNISYLNEEALIWFLKLHILNKRTYYYAFDLLCRRGELDKAKIFDRHYELQSNKVLQNEYQINFFYSSIIGNNIELAKWIHKKIKPYALFYYNKNWKDTIMKSLKQFNIHNNELTEWINSIDHNESFRSN